MNKKLVRHLLIGEFSCKRLIKSILTVYIAIVVFGYFYSNHAAFLPQPSSYADSEEICKIKTPDEKYISGLYLPNETAEFVILYSHGNAEDLGNIRPTLCEFVNEGFSIFAYDYRGYGTSTGKPSEKKAYQDIDAAYTYLTEQLKFPPDRIIIMGRSLGGAVAIDLAARKPAAGLILESTFTSALRVVTKIPISPFDRFVNTKKIKKVKCPVLVIHSRDDDIIPFAHGEKLFKLANEPKLNLWITGAAHNDSISWIAGNKYWDTIKMFTSTIKNYQKKLDNRKYKK